MSSSATTVVIAYRMQRQSSAESFNFPCMATFPFLEMFDRAELSELLRPDSGQRRLAASPSFDPTNKVTTMPDDDETLGDRSSSPPSRWRSAETFQNFLREMDEYRRSPEGRRYEAAEQAAETDLQAWLADQPGVVIPRHGGQVPEQWEGEVDGHSFYFRERGGEWAIELDLQEQPHGATQGEVIAAGTIAYDGYGQSSRERAKFIVTTIRDYLRRNRSAESLQYRVEWSSEDNEFVGRVAEFPSLSWLAPSKNEALRGIIDLVQYITADGPDGDAADGHPRTG